MAEGGGRMFGPAERKEIAEIRWLRAEGGCLVTQKAQKAQKAQKKGTK